MTRSHDVLPVTFNLQVKNDAQCSHVSQSWPRNESVVAALLSQSLCSNREIGPCQPVSCIKTLIPASLVRITQSYGDRGDTRRMRNGRQRRPFASKTTDVRFCMRGRMLECNCAKTVLGSAVRVLCCTQSSAANSIRSEFRTIDTSAHQSRLYLPHVQ